MAAREQIATGLDAHERASKVGPTATPLRLKTASVLGEILIEPGTVWGEGRKMIVTADGHGIVFFEDDVLFRQSPKDFVLDELVSVFAKAGVSAKPWRKILKTEFNFICGLLVPWYGSVGIAAAETTLFYANNKSVVDRAFKHIEKLIDFFDYLGEKHPKLRNKLLLSLGKNSILGVKHGTSGDIAHFVGRLMKGYRELKADKSKAASTGLIIASLKILVVIVLKTAAIFMALHAPVFAIKGFIGDSKKQIDEYVKEFRATLGMVISVDEAKAIRESIVKDLSASEKFSAFADDANKGLKAIEDLLAKADEEMLLE